MARHPEPKQARTYRVVWLELVICFEEPQVDYPEPFRNLRGTTLVHAGAILGPSWGNLLGVRS